MKLNDYAKRVGVHYRTAYRWYRAGSLDAYQMPTGTIMVKDPPAAATISNMVALYARVSSADQKDDLQRQLQRLKDYAAAQGYHVTQIVTELASGLNDKRPKFQKLLTDASIGTIVVEHRDRATRFGFAYIESLLQTQGRRIDVIFQTDTKDDLVDDFISVITSMASRIYGRRNSRRRAEKIKESVERVMVE